MTTRLQGTASDIMKDFADGKYEMEYDYDKGRIFIDTKTGEEFKLPEEVNGYIDELEIVWADMFDGRYGEKYQ